MFVTSDCHDPAVWTRILDDEHQEVLIGGVGLYGPNPANPHAAAEFLLRAADLAQFPPSIAGYHLKGERRTRNVLPANLLKVVAGAHRRRAQLTGLLVSNDQPGPFFGGGPFLGGEMNVDSFLSGAVVFPEQGRAIGRDLLSLAATELGAEYGYYFVRDSAFLPRGYALGAIGGSVTFGVEDRTELEDIASWGEIAVLRDDYWRGDDLRLRDVYEINLLCDRHLSLRLGGKITLGEWIVANNGSLEKLSNGRYLWTIEEHELKRVRMELSMAGALLAKHTPRYRWRGAALPGN